MEKREKRDRERDLWEEERPKLVTMRCEERKNKGKREKMRKLTMRERRRKKIMFPMTIDEDNIYRRCNA